jgi:myosin heavy subunit
VFGYENCTSNSLEQLCINYANECLHLLFVEHMLVAEQLAHVAEGLQWESVDITRNDACVALIDGAGGLFALLDEVSKKNRQLEFKIDVGEKKIVGVPAQPARARARPA